MTGREGLKVDAAAALAELQGVLSRHVTPCQRAPELWTDGTAEDAVLAAQMCQRCPVLQECGDYARAARERWHVWAGKDRDIERAQYRRRMARERTAGQDVTEPVAV